jgi:nucleotide-binding universal stress UspA family protein
MRTILCPIDLSGLSHRAVQYASEIAVRTGSRLVLFYAFDAPYLEPHCALGYAGEARERLEAVRQQLIGQDALARLNCHCEVRMGSTAREVHKYAAATEADLIVIGTCPAEEICCQSRMSLLTQLLEKNAHRVLWVPQQCRFEPLRQIVYASDLDGASLTDVSYVLNLARRYDAETAFLHIRHKKLAPVPAGDYEEEDEPSTIAATDYGNLSLCLFDPGQTAFCIDRFCENLHASLLVLATNRAVLLARILDYLRGETPEYLNRHPVLFLPTPGKAER